MTEKLTWEEIREQYPEEWVVLVDASFDDNEEPRDGVVYDHDGDRTLLYSRCAAGPARTTVLYTGEIRGGLVGFYAEEDVDQEYRS